MADKQCPCGGLAYVDDFLWPGKPLQFFLRCRKCGGMSDAVTDEASAEALVIRPDQCAEKAAHAP